VRRLYLEAAPKPAGLDAGPPPIDPIFDGTGLLLNRNPEAVGIAMPIVEDPSALAVNKIDLIKHNKEAVSYSEGIQEIKEFFAWNIGKEKLTPIGQNFSFDEEYIFEKMPSLDWRKYVSHDGFDTKHIAKFLIKTGKLKTEKNSTSLGPIAKAFDINYEGAHDAKRDVEITIEVLKKMLLLQQERD
jgi:DNA polymerase III alpha subunit (gram-positive type)